MRGRWPKSPPRARLTAFTLIEILIVAAVIATLIAILVPALGSAREASKRSVCLSNLRQIGIAIHTYAHEQDERIPFGPKALPMMSASTFYPSTGTPTSLISLATGAPVGLGLLLGDQLKRTPKVLFCPGSDQPSDADAQLALVGAAQAQSSYYYRHGSMVARVDSPSSTQQWGNHIKLNDLGLNRDGLPIKALAIDTIFPAPAGFAAFGVTPRTHHQSKYADILFIDGHAASSPNAGARYTLNLSDYFALTNAFDRILKILETADKEY